MNHAPLTTRADVTIRIQTETWMQEVRDKVDGSVAYMIGRVSDHPHTLAVTEHRTGITRFFCKFHKRIYPMLQQCPECSGIVVPELKQA